MQKQIIQSNISSKKSGSVTHCFVADNEPRFFLVSTPIGNLEDLSFRAKKTLQECDLVLCEDTRVSAKLLSAYSISAKTESLHQYNEKHRIQRILNLLDEGKRIALVSDAGTPLISDPGYQLTQAILQKNIKITAIPGANAALMALTLSGLPPHPYLFIGFPPTKTAARKNSFAILKASEKAGLITTYIWHETAQRLLDMLEDLQTVFGANRMAAIARELTKKFETVQRGTLATLIKHFTETPPKGEIIVLLGPVSPAEQDDTRNDLDKNLLDTLKTMSVKDAAAIVATAMNLPKKTVYKRALELIQNNNPKQDS